MSLQKLIERMKEEADCHENADDIRTLCQAAEVMREALEKLEAGNNRPFQLQEWAKEAHSKAEEIARTPNE